MRYKLSQLLTHIWIPLIHRLGILVEKAELTSAGVMRFVKMDKMFVGSEQTQTSIDLPIPWVCTYLEIEPNGIEDGHGGEAVLLNDSVVGSTASVAYGHTVGKILAFAYLKPEAAIAGTALEFVIAGNARPAKVIDTPAYDPDNLLPRTDA